MFNVSFDVDKLAVDEDSMRSQVGYEAEISDGQREDVRKNMLSGSQLDAAKHKQITFTSSGCSVDGGQVKVNGTLTVRGKAKNVSVPMRLKIEDGTLSARGTFTARHTDFGMEPYTAMFGQLKNKNEMKFTVSLRGNAK